ncbi:hypothetical protein RND71_030214 [Anisodus tanguticus]|uniref:Uncharacterized protein n=1 Tax=Anisodus tanguticus TaxID=243964 RepID=A0AAE1RH13_9SOLA|nr:hypothetical protein RND71_030214 [Anisodus tanguticus]
MSQPTNMPYQPPNKVGVTGNKLMVTKEKMMTRKGNGNFKLLRYGNDLSRLKCSIANPTNKMPGVFNSKSYLFPPNIKFSHIILSRCIIMRQSSGF